MPSPQGNKRGDFQNTHINWVATYLFGFKDGVPHHSTDMEGLLGQIIGTPLKDCVRNSLWVDRP